MFVQTLLHKAGENTCLLYTSDAADERSSVDLGGRRIIKKKKNVRERGCEVVESYRLRRHDHRSAQNEKYKGRGAGNDG